MKRLPIIPVVILLVIAVMALRIALPQWIITLKTPVDFNTLAEEEIRSGIRVEGDVYAILDSFATEESWTENGDGSVTPKKTSGYYYIIPIGEESYMGLEVSAGTHGDYDAVASDTWDYLIGTTETLDTVPVHFEGYIAPMEGDLYTYFVEWFQDTEHFGVTDAETIETYALPYMLSTYSLSGTYTVLGIGLGALLIAVLLVLSHLRYRKKHRQAAAPAGDPVSPTSPESVARDLEQ